MDYITLQQPYSHKAKKPGNLSTCSTMSWFWGLMVIPNVNFTLFVIVTEKQQKAMEQRLTELEANCREKEAERVDLELRLTEVKEKLKKSLTGGMLGATVDSKPPIKVRGQSYTVLHALLYSCTFRFFTG